MTIGWLLDRSDRDSLLALVAPRWPVTIADHITLRSGGQDEPLPASVVVYIIGEADDGAGVQALIAEVDGSTKRPDGGAYHITWSLDRAYGRRAVDSNAVIAQHGWRAFAAPLPVAVTPARWTWVDP